MYRPPFSISPDAVRYISEISALLERISMNSNFTERELLLRKANRVKTIHSSLAIEGNTLNEDEVKDIIDGKKVVAPLRQILEIQNAVKVYDLFPQLNPLSEKDLFKAHKVMMEGLIKESGRYRSDSVGVFGDKGLLHLAPPPLRVPQLMSQLFEWLNEGEDHLLIKSCVFHYEFEFIHPFSDGNGRMGRLWQSLILSRLHPMFEFLPVENLVHGSQEEYYASIAASTKAGESTPFIDFMLGRITEALRQYVANKVTNKVTNKSGQKILDLLRHTPTLSSRELAQRIGLSESGVKRILARMKEEGLLERVGSNKAGRWIVK